MYPQTATAVACPNIAFIKYWGNRDDNLRLPANSSISMNLAGLFTQTQVTFDPAYLSDSLSINGAPITGEGLERIRRFLDVVRAMAGTPICAQVTSRNNFPSGAGIASSASAFAALALAASSALHIGLSEAQLSRLARRGSGSACRSIPTGFVEWQAGSSDGDSYAYSIAGPEHWDLVDCIALVSTGHKVVGSSRGHTLAATSPLQDARVADAPRRLDQCRTALLSRDFVQMAEIVELESNLMHAVMFTSTPPLIYWSPATLEIMRFVQEIRRTGFPACYTIDAGPNVHVLTLSDRSDELIRRLAAIPGVRQVIRTQPGGPARLLSTDEHPSVPNQDIIRPR